MNAATTVAVEAFRRYVKAQAKAEEAAVDLRVAVSQEGVDREEYGRATLAITAEESG